MSHDLNLPPQKQSMNFSSSGARLAKFVSYYGIPRKERGCLLQKAFNNQDRPHTPFKLRDTPAKYTYYVTIRNYFGYLIILRIFNLGISCTVVVLTCFVMCGCAYVLLICVLIFIVFCIASFMYIYSYLFCLYQREDYCHRVTTQLQLIIIMIIIIIIIIIIFLNGLGRLTCSGIDALPSSPGASTVSSSSRFVVEGVFRKTGVVRSFKVVDPVLFVFESHVLYSRDLQFFPYDFASYFIQSCVVQ